MPELAEPRQQAIAAILNDGGEALVSELARRFSVSEMTIRRDLRTLEDQGLAIRVHGGAMAGERFRFTSRLSKNARAKGRAVEKLAGEIPDHGSIYLDGSTTILNLVKHLKGRSRLQVATNNIETFNRIAGLRGPTPILIGGTLDVRTDNLIGPLAMRSVEALVFDKAFFSAWGIMPETGLNEVTVEDALVKAVVAKRSGTVLVALDRSKFGVAAAGVWDHCPDRAWLATDMEPDDGRLGSYRRMFTKIV
ncbi:MAG: DeoR/GlpR family DNA-binding transcription regulator [Planctomycetes bacterium]|nr:DeoR/GlpR family DNA-binding transcription regulator [Planctomycetota bacterium]